MRIETIGAATLYCGDSMEIKDSLQMTIDVVITDPPYGIRANKMTLGKGKKDFDRGGEWDNSRPDISWIPGFARWFCIWGGNYFADILAPTNDILIWHKKNDGRSFSECELAWTNSGKQTRILSHHWSGEEKDHPTQKPERVMQWSLEWFPDAHVVLDPFMGSGTTGVACMAQGKRFVGIEYELKYFDIACRRIEDAQRQQRMFA